MLQERRLMTAFQMIVRPATEAIARLGDLVTYEDVPSVVEERSDSCPYLGHVPFFAPKLKENDEK